MAYVKVARARTKQNARRSGLGANDMMNIDPVESPPAVSSSGGGISDGVSFFGSAIGPAGQPPAGGSFWGDLGAAFTKTLGVAANMQAQAQAQAVAQARPGLSTTTMVLIGGGALALILALR